MEAVRPDSRFVAAPFLRRKWSDSFKSTSSSSLACAQRGTKEKASRWESGELVLESGIDENCEHRSKHWFSWFFFVPAVLLILQILHTYCMSFAENFSRSQRFKIRLRGSLSEDWRSTSLKWTENRQDFDCQRRSTRVLRFCWSWRIAICSCIWHTWISSRARNY